MVSVIDTLLLDSCERIYSKTKPVFGQNSFKLVKTSLFYVQLLIELLMIISKYKSLKRERKTKFIPDF